MKMKSLSCGVEKIVFMFKHFHCTYLLFALKSNIIVHVGEIHFSCIHFHLHHHHHHTSTILIKWNFHIFIFITSKPAWSYLLSLSHSLTRWLSQSVALLSICIYYMVMKNNSRRLTKRKNSEGNEMWRLHLYNS